MHATTLEYVVREDLTIRSVGGPWDRFARENGVQDLNAGAVVGRRLGDFIADPGTRGIYKGLVERVLAAGDRVRFAYRCDAPDRRRFMRMSMERVGPGLVRFRSRILREEPRPAQPILAPDIPRSADLVRMCGWCKKIELAGRGWLEVEDYVRDPEVWSEPPLPRVSHGMCPECQAEMLSMLDKAS